MSEPAGLRSTLAANASPLTLGGTRSYVVGRERIAVIDPGPELPQHLDALAALAEGAAHTQVLLTHDHPDHAAGADALAERLGASVRARGADTIAAGERVATDAGELVAIPTPGHAPDHLAFHWPAEAAVFCGDLMLGGMDTAFVAPPEGDLEQYLASLGRVRALGPGVIYPAHGPPFSDPVAALDAYVAHRQERQDQLLAALEHGPLKLEELVDAIYGPELEGRLREAAGGATRAYLDYLEEDGRVRRIGQGEWARG